MRRLSLLNRGILALVDIVLIFLSYFASLLFRFENNIPTNYWNIFLKNIPFIIIVYILVFYFFNLYRSLWTNASIDEFMFAVGACITGSLVTTCAQYLLKSTLPLSVYILGAILCVLSIGGFRMSFRVIRRSIMILNRKNPTDFKKVLVIGGGAAGTLVIKEIRSHPEKKLKVIGVIDSSHYKLYSSILGVSVIGNRHIIAQVVIAKNVDLIIIAIPSLNEKDKKEIIKICRSTNAELKILPGVYDLFDDKFLLSKMRTVNVEDLLGRDVVKLDMAGIDAYIKGKTVLVTGGGGSIGSELCRQIARFKPKQLLILDIYENNAYDLQNELLFQFKDLNLKVIIASVRDKNRINMIFKAYRPDIVFHAAAHKHVPLMEDNPSEAVKNNVFGTMNVAEAADKYCVERFVMISTDKAVNPTNVMGATKRLCEMIIQSIDKKSKTNFVAVRFGNVLASNGSVIPLFNKQIAHGGPVTVTHKDITRFFMTIPEAAKLVLQAGAYAVGGEIFILDMGTPVRIYELAQDLIKLSGFEPHIDIEIKVTGLRPGEKLYEEVLMDEEGKTKTGNDKIYVGRPMVIDIETLKKRLEKLRFVAERGTREELIRCIGVMVPTYRNLALEEVAAARNGEKRLS